MNAADGSGADLTAWSRSPHHVEPAGSAADELLRLGCLDYGTYDPERIEAAHLLLAADAGLGATTVWTMAAVGDVNGLAAALTADPEAVNREGGPFAWPPLLYLTYSRLAPTGPGHDHVAAARALLDRGADANAGFLWDGLVPPFTALTGAIGGGERGEPPHPRWHELAELLLRAGADPNDHQAIYDHGLGSEPTDDTEVLELLRAHGLGTGDGGTWARRLGGLLPTPADLLAEVLQHAAEHDLRRRAELVLSWGVDPDRRALHPLFGGRTPHQTAMRNGNLTIAGLLVAAGADPTGLDDVDLLIAHALAGDEPATAEFLAAADRVAATPAPDDAGAEPAPAGGADAIAGHAALLAAAIDRDPTAIVRAAELQRASSVRLLVELGWDVNAQERGTALHEAAWRGDDGLVDLLLGLGADATIRDVAFDGTPAAWAHHGGHPDLAARLDRLS